MPSVNEESVAEENNEESSILLFNIQLGQFRTVKVTQCYEYYQIVENYAHHRHIFT